MITMRDWLLWTSTLLVPGIGHACSCMPEGPVSSIELGTSVIFRGIVTEVTFNPNADPHRAYRVRVAVKEIETSICSRTANLFPGMANESVTWMRQHRGDTGRTR
jgi:hypothetical protein